MLLTIMDVMLNIFSALSSLQATVGKPRFWVFQVERESTAGSKMV
jgi:hypothetical protein